jgi:hypothetical protein
MIDRRNMKYLPSFTNFGSGIRNFRGGFTETDKQKKQTTWRSRKPTFIFQNEENMLMKCVNP